MAETPDPDENEYAQLQADLHAALSSVLNDHDTDGPCYLTRFVVLAEVVDKDGARALWQVAADGMKRWDTLGLLQHALTSEYGQPNNAQSD